MPKRWLANTLPAPATWLMTPSNTRRSFDDLVDAGEDRGRDRQPEGFGGVEIDDQLKPGRLLDRQIGGLGALEDLSGVDADLTNRVGEARAIADQTAGREESTPVSDRRNGMACSQRHKLVASLAEKRIRTKDERASLNLHEGRESGVYLAFGASPQDTEL